MKKVLLAILMVLVCLTCVSAVEASITWYWTVNDFDVNYFRYQLDGELDGLWTVADSFVTEVTIDGLDGSVPHGLYLQQSYDGENWSGSSVVYSEVVEEIVPVEEEPFVFEEAVVEEPPAEEPVVEEAPVEAVEVETPAEVTVPVAEEKEKPTMMLEAGLLYRNSIPDSAGPKNLGGFAAFSYLPVKLTDSILFGVRAEGSLHMTKARAFSAAINAQAMVSARVGARTNLFASVGPEFNVGSASAFGIVGELGITYKVADKFTIGAAGIYHFQFAKGNAFDIRVFGGYSF